MASPGLGIGNAISGMYGAARSVVGGLFTRFGGWGLARLRLLLPSARFDWEREAGDLWRNSVVALAVNWLGDRFPRPGIALGKVARNGEINPIGRHPIVDLWNRPNKAYTRRALEKAIGLSLKVDGNAYVQKVRNRGYGQVVELWWLPHYIVHPTWPDDGSEFIDGYTVQIDGGKYWLPAADMIHIRDGIDPLNERLGLASLKANAREVAGLNLAAGYTAALLKNSGVPGLAIVPDGPDGQHPDEDAARRIERRFGEEYANDMAGKPIVFTGRYKVVEVGFSPQKLALGDITLEMEMRIASGCGVALMSLGLRDPGKTYANLGEANRTSWGTVVSIQELIAEAVQQQLFPDFGLDPVANVFTYDYSQIQELQESLDAVHERTRNDFRFDLIRRNEAREQLGYEPDPDGDVYFSQIQLALAQAKAGGTGDEPSQTDPTDTSPTQNPVSSAGPSSTTPRAGKALALNGDGHHRRWEH